MTEYKIRITVELPDDIPRDKIIEWANYVTGYRPFLPDDNPLMGTDLEAISCSLETY